MTSVNMIKHQNYSEVLKHGRHPKQSSAAPAGTNAVEEEDTHPIINEDFPSLLVKEASPEGTQENTNNCSSKSRPLKCITKIFHVPLEKLKYKERGDQSKVCLAIMKKTGVKLELSFTKTQGLYINVSGTADVVRKAYRDIESLLQIQDSDTIVVPKEHHGVIIGKNGKVLRELELKTTTTIEIPGREDPSNEIKISGTKEALEKAKQEILLICAEQASSYAMSSVPAPSWLHGFIIGKKGQNMLKIKQQMPKVHIDFPKGDNKVTLKGPKKDVQMVQSQIEAMVTDLLNHMDYAEIRVDRKFHRNLIGIGGVNIKRIVEQHKVTVHIPPEEKKSSLIRIIGDLQGVQEAKKELLELASSMGNTKANITQVPVSIPSKLQNSVIGSNGCVVRSIEKECGSVYASPPESSGKDNVTSRGSTEDMEKAEEQKFEVTAGNSRKAAEARVPKEKDHQGTGDDKEDLQKEKERTDVSIKEARDQPSVHQTETGEKTLKEKMDDEVTHLKELLKEKDKQLCKANVCAENYKYSLQQLKETQSDLEATKLQCATLEEDLKKRIERDDHHLKELSERKDVFRKQLLEQEEWFNKELAKQKERFQQELGDREAMLKQKLSEKEKAYKKDLSEQEETSKNKIAHLEDNLKQQLSEAESCRKVACEHEERWEQMLDNIKQQLLEKEEAYLKDLSEQEETSKNKIAHLEDNLKRQLSEAESCRKVACEHEERWEKALDYMKQQLLEKESIQKELADMDTKAQLPTSQREEELQCITEEHIQQELLPEEAKKKKKGFLKRLFKRKNKNPDASALQ